MSDNVEKIGDMASCDSVSTRGGGLGEALRENRTKVADLKMIQQAIRQGWDVPPAIRRELGEIMAEIVRQRTAPTVTMEGEVVDVSNARNQIAAAKVLIEADRLNQTDYWNQDKNDRLDAGKSTENIGVAPTVVARPVARPPQPGFQDANPLQPVDDPPDALPGPETDADAQAR